MAILIDMDMPENCGKCEILVDCDGCEGWQCMCGITHRDIGYARDKDAMTSKPDWCPLKEVVKCKDCKHWGQDGYKEGCKYAVCIVTENDWCSFAERREE